MSFLGSCRLSVRSKWPHTLAVLSPGDADSGLRWTNFIFTRVAVAGLAQIKSPSGAGEPPICEPRSTQRTPLARPLMTEHPITERQRRMTLITCVLASSLAFIDSSVINVGLPAIGRA